MTGFAFQKVSLQEEKTEDDIQNNFKKTQENMHFLPILYSSCWIVSQSHASLHIVREEKQIFTITAGKDREKKKKAWNIFKANMNKNWMQLK